MAKVLITGGCGFVGRRFVKYFLEKNHEVIVVDNIYPGTGALEITNPWPNFDPRDFKKFHFFKQDCREWFKKKKHEKFDLIFHLAAIVGGRLVIENNPIAVGIDLAIDAAMWEWAKIARPKKVICFSSSAAYPIKFQAKNSYKLLSEQMINFKKDIGMPDMSYGWAKLTCEYLAKLAYEKEGIKSVCYRPFSGYGDDQDLNYPFPSILTRALKHKNNSKKFHVWGSGKQMRDFVHIDDCIHGVIKTMNKVNNGDAINLSTGKLTSFIDFAKITLNILGHKNIIVQGTSEKPEGVFARGGCMVKQKKMGVEHKISFQKGIEDSLILINRRL